MEGCTLHVSFEVRKGEATRRNIGFPIFERDDYFTTPEMAAPQRFLAATGMCITEDGTNGVGERHPRCPTCLAKHDPINYGAGLVQGTGLLYLQCGG